MNLNAPFKHELADCFGISRRTLYNWVDANSELRQKFGRSFYNVRKLTLKQAEQIFKVYGTPPAYANAGRAELRTYTRAELADFFGLDYRTFMERLKYSMPEKDFARVFSSKMQDGDDFVNESKRRFDIPAVEIIFKWLGHPYNNAGK